jgi:secreted protein with Ig-like and vWFA domain
MYVIDFQLRKIARFNNEGLMLFINELFKYRDSGLVNQRYFLVNNKKLANKIIKQALGGKPI